MLDPLAAARRGFMVVIQDTRGRFASDGEWEPWTYEESDGVAALSRGPTRTTDCGHAAARSNSVRP
jgi:hypothetical protein